MKNVIFFCYFPGSGKETECKTQSNGRDSTCPAAHPARVGEGVIFGGIIASRGSHSGGGKTPGSV